MSDTLSKEKPSPTPSGKPVAAATTCSLPVVEALNALPEVTWDRWSGDGIEHASVFGWIPREDGRCDFVYVMIDKDGPWLVSTSSARYSSEFSQRLLGGNPDRTGHNSCKRVEDHFPVANCVRLKAENDQVLAQPGETSTNTENDE